MVPTSDNGGGWISFFCGGGGGGAGAGSEATKGGDGRRDGEKSGRSRVPDNLVSGIAHNGLALSGLELLWQDFAVGVLIIVAVTIDQWIRKLSA